MTQPKPTPLFADLRGRACLVVGGGVVAERRIGTLRAAGAEVTVIAPRLTRALEAEVRSGSLTHLEGPFSDQPLDPYWLVVAATDDRETNAAVFAAAEAAHRFCNVVDDPEHCSVIMPARVERGPITIAISSGGASPTLVRWLKGRIEALVPARVGALTELVRDARERVRAALPSATARRRFWARVIEGPVGRAALAGRRTAAESLLDAALADGGATDGARGEAYLVGAGPGDAELLTLRGRQLLAQADVVLYDRLVGTELLDYARRDAELICVGKTPGRPSITQKQLCRLLVGLVGSGKRVCRLKGGDPMMFGRAAEELEALTAAGLPFEIVPGVSAVQGAAAYAGIPLTMRGVAHAVRLTTARTEHGAPAELPRPDRGQTLAVYMGVARFGEIGPELIAAGHAPDTPIAIIERATTRAQRIVRASLAELGAAATAFAIASPALLLIGETTRHAERYSWFGSGQLHHYRAADAAEGVCEPASRRAG